MLSYIKYFFFFVLFCVSLQAENYSYFDLLQVCQPEQRQALQKASSFLNIKENTQFQSLEGGLTRAKIYAFEVEGTKYVIRFLALSFSKEMRQNEIQALKVGNALGIAPACLYSDPDAIILIMPFVQGHALRHPNDQHLEKMGKMLNTIHHYSGPYPTRYSLNDRLAQQYQKGVEFGIAYPTGFDQEVQKVLSKKPSRALVPSHGDLNPSNILVDDTTDEIQIIDWTTATWEDPFFDLSYLCLLANLLPEQEEVFLNAYFGRKPSEYDFEIIKQEKAKICLLTAAIWFRFSETAEEIASPIEKRIRALDVELYSQTLRSIKEYLKEGIVIHLHTAPKAAVRSYALSFYRAYLEMQNVADLLTEQIR